MNPITDLIARFSYTADKRDRWTLLDAPTGPLRGDCEDYSLTALWICAGRSWLRLWWLVATFQAMIWLTRTASGQMHVMLWVRGRGWTDNIYPQWSSKCRHPKIAPYLAPLLAVVLLAK
jgi:hypothetical protein